MRGLRRRCENGLQCAFPRRQEHGLQHAFHMCRKCGRRCAIHNYPKDGRQHATRRCRTLRLFGRRYLLFIIARCPHKRRRLGEHHWRSGERHNVPSRRSPKRTRPLPDRSQARSSRPSLSLLSLVLFLFFRGERQHEKSTYNLALANDELVDCHNPPPPTPASQRRKRQGRRGLGVFPASPGLSSGEYVQTWPSGRRARYSNSKRERTRMQPSARRRRERWSGVNRWNQREERLGEESSKRESQRVKWVGAAFDAESPLVADGGKRGRTSGQRGRRGGACAGVCGASAQARRTVPSAANEKGDARAASVRARVRAMCV